MPGCKVGDIARFLSPSINVGRLVKIDHDYAEPCEEHHVKGFVCVALQTLEHRQRITMGGIEIVRHSTLPSGGLIVACDAVLQPLPGVPDEEVERLYSTTPIAHEVEKPAVWGNNRESARG